MIWLNYIVYFLIFPGFLFTAITGLIASWIDRKLTARIQFRVGPPFLQPFYDLAKLFGKETLIPKAASKGIFLTAPLLGLTAVTLESTILWSVIFHPERTFIGDLIVILYLSIIPSLAVILGGAASRNPLASIGAGREMKLILGYELPFILACLVPIIKSGSILLGNIVDYQANHGLIVSAPSGILAFIVALFCVQAKLTLTPFDIPEAETEIIAGPYTEYSGFPLAIFKLTKAMLLFVLPMLLVTLFLGGKVSTGWSLVLDLLKYLGVLILIILIRNTNPRVRIDQAIKFFWLYLTCLALLGVFLALVFGK